MESQINYLNLEYIFGKIFNFFYNLIDFFRGVGRGNRGRTTTFDRTDPVFEGRNVDYAQYEDIYSQSNSLFEGTTILQNTSVRTGILIFVILILVLIAYLIVRFATIRKEESARAAGYFVRPAVEERKNMRWEKIKALFQSPHEADWRLAIIEADAMLEEMVIHLGYEGETLADRMKKIKKADFPTLQDAWEAHLMRNKIAHEGLNFHLAKDEALRTYRQFEKVFRDAQYI